MWYITVCVTLMDNLGGCHLSNWNHVVCNQISAFLVRWFITSYLCVSMHLHPTFPFLVIEIQSSTFFHITLLMLLLFLFSLLPTTIISMNGYRLSIFVKSMTGHIFFSFFPISNEWKKKHLIWCGYCGNRTAQNILQTKLCSFAKIRGCPFDLVSHF